MRVITKFSNDLSSEDVVEKITENIISTGFRCNMCGECCLSHEGQNMVIVSAPEIREIMKKTSLEWDQVAEPYPEFIEEDGTFFTFSWILRKSEECCVFFRYGRCSIYECRPSLCRTYPFMIAENALCVSECKGVGLEITSSEAEKLAFDLIERNNMEEREEKLIEMEYNKKILNKGCYYVIDSEGVKNIDW